MAATTTKAATPKVKTGAGVKKAARPGKKGKASQAMAQMQAFCESDTF
jgi:hypothetical protein